MKLTSGILLLLLIIFAYFTPFLSPYSPNRVNLEQTNWAPSMKHPFGTDDLGRDLFTRAAVGARVSLTVAFFAALIDMVIGVIYGAVAGYFGRTVDEVMMRIADACYSLPFVLVVTVIVLFLPKGLFSIILALSFLGWITMARVVRGHVLQIKNQNFVTASITFGAGFFHIFRKHILPNLFAPIMVTMTLTIPKAIFGEAYIGFLGLSSSSTSSLGVLARDAFSSMRFYPWRIFFPALIIVWTILSFHLLGNALRRWGDPTEEIC